MTQWKQPVRAALVALSLALAPTMARAQVTQYTTLASFLTSVSNPGTDTYAGFDVTETTPSPINRAAGPYNYTAAVTTTSFFGAGTAADPWLSTNTATDAITFSGFTSTVRGIGGNFFGSNIGGEFQSGDIRIDWTEVGGAIGSYTINNATIDSFFGVYSAGGGFTSFVVSSVQPTTGFLWPTVDNFVLGAAGRVMPDPTVVPEPQSIALVGVGLLAVGMIRRRRQQQRAV